MVKIRLSLVGKRNAPAYRIVVCDEKVHRDGKNIEVIGHYNPAVNPPTFVYDKERYKYWKSVGAQPTEAVEKLIAGKYEYKKYEPKKERKEEDTSKESAEEKAEEPKTTAPSSGEKKEIETDKDTKQ